MSAWLAKLKARETTPNCLPLISCMILPQVREGESKLLPGIMQINAAGVPYYLRRKEAGWPKALKGLRGLAAEVRPLRYNGFLRQHPNLRLPPLSRRPPRSPYRS